MSEPTRARPKQPGAAERAGFVERRDPDKNRRRNGWRWYAARSDRRQRHIHARPNQLLRKIRGRFGGRRIRHRRAEDRDDGDPRMG
jgi:hypothetical protein